MAFANLRPTLEADANTLVSNAKAYILNVIDTASQQTQVVVPKAADDVIALVRSEIPSSATEALAIFDQIATGTETEIDSALVKKAALAFQIAHTKLAALIPDTVYPGASSSSAS